MEEIISNFKQEALSAPSLFSDLAKVELYIAESYRTRSLIELLQNSDDCGSTDFLMLQDGSDLIVCNNGKSFTKQDVVSLCRSGSSTKERGAGSIGYRGIGFKSVAGICKEIEVISGDYQFEYSKLKTLKLINSNSDVPLIRIPHKLTNIDKIKLKKEMYNLNEYNTIFIFKDVNFRLIEEEIRNFSSSSCIFLNNLKTLDLRTNKESIKVEINDDGQYFELISENEKEAWIVREDVLTQSKIALLYKDNEIIPASEEKSLIHAFLPTEESPGAALKFNGDFSTDPSRKNIDYDDVSLASFDVCSEILSNLIMEALRENKFIGLFSIFSKKERKKEKLRLAESISKKIKHGFYFGEYFSDLESLRLCPSWLSYSDYLSIKSKHTVIPKETISTHPDSVNFFQWLGVRDFSINDIVFKSNFEKVTVSGLITILGVFSRKNRFIITRNDIEKLKNIKIFQCEGLLLSANDVINENKVISEDFFNLINESEYSGDINHFLKVLGIKEKETVKEFEYNSPPLKIGCEVIEKVKNKKDTKAINIKKWRSAEVNLKDYISHFSGVLNVKDVSKAHVGYDLEVRLKNGEELCVEVKSVKSDAEAFEITNNEYAVGSELGDNYFIAIVKESGDDFDVSFIKNPIRKLNFEKRIKVTSWVCDAYEEKLIKFEEII